METFFKNIIESVFLFEGFSDDEFKQLFKIIDIKSFKKNSLVFIEGTIAREFYIVASGKVKIYKLSQNGDEHILHIHIAGDIIAEASIFDLKVYPAFCMALEETQLISIPNDKFYSFLEKNPKLALKLLATYSKRLREFVAKIADLSFRNVKSRLARFILDECGNMNGCKIKLSKKELSSYLGTIPETLSRSLDYLKKNKLIEEKGEYIYIIDKEKLKIISEN